MSRRRAATAVIAVVTPAVATFGASTASAAEAPDTAPATNGTFNGQAHADGIRATIAMKDYLIVEDFVDGGGPTAQATVDSLGESKAFSSLPYPGPTGIAFPGLVSTLSGKSVPGYPFYVQSQDPSTPEITVTQPGYLMQAESAPTRSAAKTQAGATTTTGEEFGSFSVATVDVIDGLLTSSGEARSRLAMGALALNGAISKAIVTVAPGGKITKTASFEASSLRIGTMQIGVTEHGLVVGDQTTRADQADPVTDAVTSSGITVKFLPAVQTTNSVLSSGLEISMEKQIPNVGNAKGVVRYVVGRTYAQATAAGLGASTVGDIPVSPNASAPAPAPASPEVALPSAVSGAESGAPVVAPQPVAPAAVPAPTAPTAPTAAPAEVPTVELVQAAAGQRPLTEVTFYPLLVALVPILLIAAVAARRFI